MLTTLAKKLRTTAVVIGMVSLATPIGSQATSTDIQLKKSAGFQVFNAMLYKRMPPLGIRLAVVYESSFFPEGAVREDGTPTDAGIESAVATAKASTDAPWYSRASFVAIDVERWHVWPFAKGDEHKRSVERYADVAKRFRAGLGQPVCQYGIAPEAGINQAVQSATDPAMMRQWRSASKVTQELLVPQVDALCPPLYSYYGSDNAKLNARHLENWKVFARQTIAEARRLAPDKPVYVFAWPQYHNGGSIKDHRFIDKAVWREQLLTIRGLADGIILWGGWNFKTNTQLAWDPDADWYQAYKDVFEE